MQCLSTCVGARVLCVHLPGLNLACAPPRGGDARKACHVACPVARGREPRRPARKPDTIRTHTYVTAVVRFVSPLAVSVLS